MARYKLNPDAGLVFLPGHGRVKPGDVLIGEQWNQYSPKLLVEVPDSPSAPPLETRVVPPKPRPLEMPEPLEESPLEADEPVTSPDRKVLTEDRPKTRMTRRKR